MTTLSAALAYALAGVPVLPLHYPVPTGCSCHRLDCRDPGKHPITRHGKDDASTDVAVITEWQQRWPAMNVGLRPPPGLAVLDFDPRNGAADSWRELRRRYGPLPVTLTARTGSGGYHVWLAYAGPVRGKLAPGIDVKSSSGYLVAPPSLHFTGRRYEWITLAPTAPAPEWLRLLLVPPMRARPVSTGVGNAAGLVRVVANAPDGNRNRLLYWAACRAHERGSDAGLLAELQSAAESTGRPGWEAARTVDSAARTVGVGG